MKFLPKNYLLESGVKRLKQVLASKTIKSINPKTYATIAMILLGAFSLGAIQSHNEVGMFGFSKPVTSRALADNNTTGLGAVMFGSPEAAQSPEAIKILDKQTRLVTTRDSFMPALAVVKRHANTIKTEADAVGIPQDVAIGIALLENGGSERATSSAGARGLYQFMPATARNYGLVVTSSQDDRVDPIKSTEAAMQYLKDNHAILKDWGLAVWSYHAGAGNVCKAVRVWARANHNVELGNCSSEVGNFVVKNKITISKLMSDPSVKAQVTSRLQDDSSGYPYKVMATAAIFNLAEKLSDDEFAQRLAQLNIHGANVEQFFNS